MGFFGPSIVELAVYRQLDHLRDTLWGNHFDDPKALVAKEAKISEFAATLKSDDRGIRKAQSKWIRDARQSIINCRIDMVKGRKMAEVKLPPLPVSG